MKLTPLNESADRHAKSSSIMAKIFLAPMSSIVDDFPKAIEATILTNILKPGEVFVPFAALTQSVNPNAEVGESPLNGKLTLTPIIEGISKRILAWVYENAGKRFIVVWERCSDRQRFIAGDFCSGGLEFTYTGIGTQDKGMAGIATKFEGGECPEPFWFYDGPLPLAEAESVAADATTFALTDNFQYQLSQNAADTVLTDITNVTDADVGRIIDIVGSGGQHPTKITASSKFILSKGIDFVGEQGSRITFQIIKPGTANEYAFLEVYRA